MDLFHWLSFQQPWHENFVDVIWLFDPLFKQYLDGTILNMLTYFL